VFRQGGQPVFRQGGQPVFRQVFGRASCSG